ncbi:glycosyltransferase family 4 protein [Desulfocurvibacter africanus]|uniref:glycosyltransferase family 4 protein n=1 Tax=Desulfocurvibacter africanus TaxID=873 RepID=UPI00040A4639|nr:glycosyltransferase family 4 protein [Desulfocurvibacter africanus]
MRILQINTEKTWRGGERQTFYTLRGLAAAGVQVELLCRAGAPLVERASALPVRVHPVSGQLGALSFLAGCKGRYDVLHAQTAKGQSLAAFTKPAHRTPLVYTRRVDFRPSGLAARIKYRMTNQIVAISQAIADILADFGLPDVPVIPSAVLPTPAGIEPAVLEARTRPELGLGDRRIIGTIAALVEHKDPLTMVEAVAKLRGLRGEDFAFLHFGDGPLLEQAKSRAKELGLAGTYHFMGFSPQVIDYLRIFQVFVMSSREEGLGSTVLDAFLEGIPVASTEAGGLKELVAGRGLLAPVGDAATLALAMSRLLDETDLRADVVAKARAYVTAHHDLGRLCQEYISLYKTLIGNKSRHDGR